MSAAITSSVWASTRTPPTLTQVNRGGWAYLEVRRVIRFDHLRWAGVVQFRLEGEAESLEVAEPGAEVSSFSRGDVQVTLEMEVSDQGNETGDCLVVAQTTREVSEEAYELLKEELGASLADAAVRG